MDKTLSINLVVSEEAKELGAFLWVGEVEGLTIPKVSEKLDMEVLKGIEQVQQKYQLETLKDEPSIRALRDFFWKVDIDPTKKRPSSEALIRRILQKGEIPRIHPAVDAGNLASFSTHVPIGLFDRNKISSHIILRRAKEGEIFEAIGGKDFSMSGKEVVLVDQGDEHLIHQFPYRDCRRTSIQLKTSRVLIVACGVPGLQDESVKGAGQRCARLMVSCLGGRSTNKWKRA